jgi:hypothetical protein
MDGNAKDYHGRLNLFTSGLVAYSTDRKLGTHTAEFSGQGFLHQNAHECYSIGTGLRMWGWFRLDGTQATSIYSQNIISLGNMAAPSTTGPPTVTGAGGIAYINLGAGASTSVGPMQTYQQNQFGGYTQTPTRRGAWPVPTPAWSFFHLTYTSTGCISHTGTENQTTLATDHIIGANKFYGSTTLLPVFIGGGSTDSRQNAGFDLGGSTTGATTIKIENIGFSTSIDNYTAKATNLFNSGNGRVCPAST